MREVAFVLPAAMLVALALDRGFGELPDRWHPVAGMGRYLAWAGRRLPTWRPGLAFVGGALAWCFGALVCTGVAVGIEQWLWRSLPPHALWPLLALAAALGLLLEPMLAWRMLRDEVDAVEAALARGLPQARAQVARLASRATAELDAGQVRETAIETLAENLNDSVVAPLFWFALAGLPGAVLYRFANTADAMWGYRDRREWSGKWAARADDVLSWLPARLTGLLLLPDPRRWPALRREAQRTPSPNGGWPMGAMALALGVLLRKPGVYALNDGGRRTCAGDTPRAQARAASALGAAALLLMALAFGLRRGFA
jgi:adenosylcobinamide-phosphate synthase